MEENKEIMTEEVVTTEEVEIKETKNNRNNKDRKPRKDFKKREPQKKLLEEKVISITRVTKVTKGGRHFRFAATMVVGDGKGLVGIGTANKNLVKVNIVDGRTISHEQVGKCGRANVLLKPAKEGTGIIAGGAARAVLEIAGVKDIVSKSLGSNTKVNVAKATLEALKSQRSAEHIAALRGKTREEL